MPAVKIDPPPFRIAIVDPRTGIASKVFERFLLTLWTNVGGTTGGITTIANGGTGADNASQARQNLGLEIGVNVQAYSAYLDEAVAFFADTDITGEEAEELTDNSDTKLHNHSRQIAARIAYRI